MRNDDHKFIENISPSPSHHVCYHKNQSKIGSTAIYDDAHIDDDEDDDANDENVSVAE